MFVDAAQIANRRNGVGECHVKWLYSSQSLLQMVHNFKYKMAETSFVRFNLVLMANLAILL